MRVVIVDTDSVRAQQLHAPLLAAGTESTVLQSWEATSHHITTNKPDLLVALFSTLVADGLGSFLAADAQLRVLRIPTLLLYLSSERRDLEAVRALCSFRRIVELPSDPELFVEILNEALPGIAAPKPQQSAPAKAQDAGFASKDQGTQLFNSKDAYLSPGTKVDRRYVIEEFVAAGGMGQIYRARQEPLGRPVALKVVRWDLAQDPEAIARFKLEAKTVSLLSDPHTVVLFDYGIDDAGIMFFAMEWLEGDTLGDLLEREGAFSPRRAAYVARQVALSLSNAHRRNIVHRDMKPGNVFLLTNQATPDYVKVLDFGVAKLVDGPLANPITEVGSICGTPEVMSPEQARGDELDGRCDIYALGCCLHAALTGTLPFRNEVPVKVVMQHMKDPFPRLPASIPEVMQKIVDKCSAKKVEDRYPTGEDAAAALTEFIDAWDAGAYEPGAEQNAAPTLAHVQAPPQKHANKDDAHPAAGAANSDHRIELMVHMHEDVAADAIDQLRGLQDSREAGTDAYDLNEAISLTDDVEPTRHDIEAPHEEIGETNDIVRHELDQRPPSRAKGPRATRKYDKDADPTLLNEAPGSKAAAWMDSDNDRDAREAESGATMPIALPNLSVGSLNEVPVPRILYLVSVLEKSGTLSVTRGRLAVNVDIRAGELLSNGTSARPFEGLLGSFAWTAGDYAFDEHSVAEGNTLDVLPLMHEGIRLRVSVNAVAVFLSEHNNFYPVVTTLFEDQREAFSKLGECSQVLSHCDGTKTVGQLVMNAGVAFEPFGRALILGHYSDSIIFVDEPTPAPLTVSYTDAHPVVNRPKTADLAQLIDSRCAALEAEPYKALGIKPGCGEDAVRRATHDFRRHFSRSKLTQMPPALASKARRARNLTHELEAKLKEQERTHARTHLTPAQTRVLDVLITQKKLFSSTSPYEAFNLWSGCGHNAIEDRYFEFVPKHHPDQYATIDNPIVRETANDVFIAMQKAYETLKELEISTEETNPRPSTTAVVKSRKPRSGHSRPVTAPTRPITGSATQHPSSTPPRTSPATQRPASAKPHTAHPRPRSGVVRTTSAPRPLGPSKKTTPTNDTQDTWKRENTSASSRPRESAGQRSSAERSAPRGNVGFKQRKMSEILAARAAGQKVASDILGTSTGPHDEADQQKKKKKKRRSTLKNEGLKSPEEHYAQGIKFFDANQFEAAKKAFSLALERVPDDGKYGAYLAWVDYLCELSTVDEARSALRASRKLKNGDIHATYFLGRLAFREDDLEKAREYFAAVVARKPEHQEATQHLRLVQTRLEEGKSKGLFNRFLRKVKTKLDT